MLEGDLLASKEHGSERSTAAIRRWLKQERNHLRANAALLTGPAGRIDAERFDRLYADRDNRPVTLKE